MKFVVTGAGLAILATAFTGCSSLPQSHEVQNYRHLPGYSNSMYDSGPGVFNGHYSKANGGGYLIYSNDKSENALINQPGGPFSGDTSESSSTPAVQSDASSASRSGAKGAGSAVGQAASKPPSGASGKRPVRAEPTSRDDRVRQYQRYERFRQYERFKNLPRDAGKRQDFREWQKWKRLHDSFQENNAASSQQ